MKNINRPLGAMEKKQRSFELEIFEAAEGGGHFMFIENPGKFNRRVLQFLSPSLEANQEKQTAELDTLCCRAIALNLLLSKRAKRAIAYGG